MKKLILYFLGIVGTIILGAIGSGLWERLLGPFLDWLTKFTIGLYASVIVTYSDSIYENASKGFHEYHSRSLYSILISLLPMLYFLLLMRHPTQRGKTEDGLKVFLLSRNGYWFIFALAIAVTFGSLFSGLRLRHINETITYSLASLEIIRPTVGEVKYIELRSRYYSMRTTSEFRSLNREITEAAIVKNRKLPAYEPL